MRTLRWSAIITVALVLVGGAVAVGQSPGSLDPMRSGSVTIDVVDLGLVTPSILVPDDAKAVYHADGQQRLMNWVSSDPRLFGQVTATGNRHINRDGSGVETETYTVVNDGGRWLGLSTGLAVAQPAPDLVVGNGLLPAGPGHQDFILFRGEGSYEGLSALVHIDWTQVPAVGAGTIFRGELPTTAGLDIAG